MRVIPIILVAALAGILAGAALAYVEVAPSEPSSSPAPDKPVASLGPETDQSGPRAEISDKNFDFGTMQRGTTQSHEFVIRNVGEAALTLEAGPTSCKCALSEVTNKPVLPGESTHVRLTWTARVGAGDFRQTAAILTNDPLESRIELSVAGKITEPVSIVPPELLFDKVTAGEAKSAEVVIMSLVQDELTVTDPELSNPRLREFFDVAVEPVARESLPDPLAKSGMSVKVTAKRGLPLGRIDQWLKVKTNLPDAEAMEIPLVGRVVGNISVHGNLWNDNQGALHLGQVKSTEGATANLNVVIRNEAVGDVKLEVLSCDPPELVATLGDPRQLKESLIHVPLKIEVPAGTRPMVHLGTDQSDEGRVILKTALPEAPELVLGVRFAVER